MSIGSLIQKSRITPDDEQLAADLIRDEGEVLYAYQDHLGFWTIGIGHLIDKRKGGGISRAASRFLFAEDVAAKIAELDRALPWWRSLSIDRQRVLVNMTFNLGISGLLKFKNTLAAMERGDYEAAAKGMLASRWAQQVGERSKRLAKVMRGS